MFRSNGFMRTAPFLLIAILAFVDSFFGGHPDFAFIVLIPALLIAFVILAITYAEKPRDWGIPKRIESAHSKRKTWLTIGTCVAMTFSILFLHWPLRISFAFSKPALEKLAFQAKKRQPITKPISAGVFEIEEIFIDGEQVSLLTNFSGEPAGFEFGPSASQSGYTDVIFDKNWSFFSSL